MNSIRLLKKELGKAISLDLRSLAIFRVGIGVMMLLDTINIFRDIIPFYTDKGVLPIANLACGNSSDCNSLYTLTNLEGTFSLHAMNGSIYFQIFLLVLTSFFAINLIIGHRTRLMTLLCWIMLVSVQNRNPAVLQGGDVIFRMMLFFAIFLPLGAKFSIDSFQEKIKYGVSKFQNINRVASFATIAFITQIALLYIFAGMLKDHPEWNKNFTATYYVLNLEIFATNLGEWISQFYGLMRLFTFGGYFLELFAGYLIIFPIKNWVFRTFIVLVLIGFHFSLAMFMHLGLFSYILIVGLLGLLPTEFMDFLVKQISIFIEKQKTENRKQKIENRNLKYESRITNHESSITKTFNKGLSHYTKLSTRLTNFLESNIEVSSKTKSKDIKKESLLTYLLLNLIPTFVIMIVFFWNLGHFKQDNYLDKTFNEIAIFFRFDQNWNMFAPSPFKDDGWFILWGTYADGTEKNLFGREKQLKYERPKDLSAEMSSQRWRKYMINLYDGSYSAYRPLLLNYVCEKENKNEDNYLIKVEMEYVRETVVLPGQIEHEQIVELGEYYCN